MNRKEGVFLENNFKGGIHIVDTPEEVREVAEKMVGQTLMVPNQQNNDMMYNTGS